METEKSVVEKNKKETGDARSLHVRGRWVIVVLALLMIIILVVVAMLLSIKKSDEIASEPINKDDFNSLVIEIQSNSNAGIEDASKLADESIKATNDNYQKTFILVTKAGLYYDRQEYDRALEIAMEAYNIERNDNVCSYIARLYEKKGDKQKSIEYYQYAIDWLKVTDPDDGDIEYYENMIKLLNGQAIDYEE